jgi:putative redox protein
MGTTVVVHSEPKERFTQVVETGKHHFYADEPESVGGSDRGPGPYDFLLAALGS